MDINTNNMNFHAVHYERSLGKLYAFVTAIDVGASGKGTGKKYYWGEVSDFDIEADIRRVMQYGGKWPLLELMQAENERLKSALEEMVNEPQPLGIDRPVYQRALRFVGDSDLMIPCHLLRPHW